MGGLAGAWLAGEGIAIWRQVRSHHHLPVPGQLLAITGLFMGLALIGEAIPRSRTLVTALAWGLDVAGLLNLWPAGLGGQVQTAAAEGTGQGSAGQAAGAGAAAGAAGGGASPAPGGLFFPQQRIGG